MKNSVDVRIAFSFKGEDYAPQMNVDLDELMKASGNLPDFYFALAKQNKIDTYSYLYEVMESSGLYFDNATGPVAIQCVDGGRLDMPKFERLWREQYQLSALQSIMKNHGLTESTELVAALSEAYELGKAG